MSAAVVDLREERFRRDVERVHNLGAPALYRLLDELGARQMIRTEIESLVSRAARLDPAAITAAGADRWPPP